MGVIIGFATIANLNGRCAANVNWGANPNTQRLYCLNGSFAPFLEIERPTVNVNMTIYSPGPVLNVEPSQSCTTQDSVAEATVYINPAGCEVNMPRVNYKMVVNSYSFAKDDGQMPGQETFSMVRWVNNEPSYVIRGIAEGTASLVGGDTSNPNVARKVGVVFNGNTSVATQGSVAAAAVGRADAIRMGAVGKVGGATATTGETGRADVSIPHTPLWM